MKACQAKGLGLCGCTTSGERERMSDGVERGRDRQGFRGMRSSAAGEKGDCNATASVAPLAAHHDRRRHPPPA